MEHLQLLAVALGLASLAGLNLYLTVFITGLSIQQHWIVLLPQYESLNVLAHPAILVIAGLMYLIEFFADKIPWVDSVWDFIHTVIRPIGGAFLAIRVLGHTNSVIDVSLILLAGSVTLLTHGMKASTRLLANSSPEPFSNIGLSLLEDITVIGGLALIHFHPVIALGVLALLIALIIYLTPKMFRSLRVKTWLIWKKLNAPAFRESETILPTQLPSQFSPLFDRLNLLGEHIVWAVPCISGASKQIPANLFGYLIATEEEPQRVYFVAKIRWSAIAETLEIPNFSAQHDSRFLSENLSLLSLENKARHVFIFPRTDANLVEKVRNSFVQRAGQTGRYASDQMEIAKPVFPTS